MAVRKRISREAILKEAAAIVVAKGAAALTFQALATRLGVSKQAVIYWYPTKQELARDLTLPSLQAEAEAAIEALRAARSTPEAIACFVRALVAHHLADLPRFRFTYLAPQLDEQAPQIMAGIKEEIHAATSAMYGALEARLAVDAGAHPRQLAVAVHMAVLGLVTMVSLSEAVEDPLAHETEVLVEALVQLLTSGASSRPRPSEPSAATDDGL